MTRRANFHLVWYHWSPVTIPGPRSAAGDAGGDVRGAGGVPGRQGGPAVDRGVIQTTTTTYYSSSKLMVYQNGQIYMFVSVRYLMVGSVEQERRKSSRLTSPSPSLSSFWVESMVGEVGDRG